MTNQSWVVWPAAFAVVMAAPLMWWAWNDPVTRSLRKTRKAQDSLTDVRALHLQKSRKERMLEPLLDLISGRIAGLAPSSFTDKTARNLMLAGRAGGMWTPARVLAARVMGLAVGGTYAVFYLLSSPSLGRLVMAAACAFGSFTLPEKLVTRNAKPRQESIGKDLPDILDQITITVEAGLGFDSAIRRVAAQSEGALAEELGRTMQDVQLGVSREEAFEGLLDRTDAPDLKQFVTSLQQAVRLGMPLGKVLRVQSAELRQRRRARAEEKAMKLGVKMTFPTVTCILPALLIAVMGPAVITMMNSGIGG